MGLAFSVEHNISAIPSTTKAVMLLVYESRSLTPLSILNFVRAPASFSGNPILIVEPFDGEVPVLTAPIKEKISYTDTLRTIHTIYKLTPYQFKTYRLWLLTSPTISQNMTNEVINFSRKYPFSDFNCDMAIDAQGIFYDLKNFTSFSAAIRPPSAGLRCSSPIRAPVQQHQNLFHMHRSHAAPLMTTFMSAAPQAIGDLPQQSNQSESNDIDFVEDGLYIGNEAAAQDRELLSQNGITHIVNLNGHSTTPAFPGGFEYYTVKLSDHVFEVLDENFWNAFEFVKSAIRGGGKVLVHCRRGISRSAALCVAYIMDSRKISFDEAFNALKKQRPAVNINQGFVEQLKAREHMTKTLPKKMPPFLNLSKH